VLEQQTAEKSEERSSGTGNGVGQREEASKNQNNHKLLGLGLVAPTVKNRVCGDWNNAVWRGHELGGLKKSYQRP